MKYANTYRLCFVNCFIVSSIVVAFAFGYVTPFFENDLSHLTYVLAAIMVFNLFAMVYDTIKNDKGIRSNYLTQESRIRSWFVFIQNNILYIGLSGTLVGFSILLKGIDTSGDVPTALEHMKTGGLTLANSTLFGVIGWVWINLNNYLVGREGE